MSWTLEPYSSLDKRLTITGPDETVLYVDYDDVNHNQVDTTVAYMLAVLNDDNLEWPEYERPHTEITSLIEQWHEACGEDNMFLREDLEAMISRTARRLIEAGELSDEDRAELEDEDLL